MTKVALRAYNHEIESMIEHGQRLDEAVAHCRHILTIYPKHLDTYRLLGKAYLEGKRHDQAVDIFQRVLVAAPEDFVSHVGMSIIADDQGKLDDAIWHMERAFEVQPSNAAIQAELQRLFGRRDGVEPAKIRLTRGALAHMYVQGELYTQAISEIRAVLANDPQRMDMQVLLARAYFRNGQKAEATDVCSALLGVAPYCLDANRLMAEILPGTQAADAAQEYRRRVLELDPYAEFAKGSTFATDAVADAAVTLDRLEQTGDLYEAATPMFGLTTEGQTAGASSAAPSWLMPGSQKEPSEPSQIADDQDLPEFLRGSGWREVPAGADEPAVSADVDSAGEADPGELPDWVRALAPRDDQADGQASMAVDASDATWGVSEPPSGERDSRPAAAADEGTPDWLRDLAQGAESSFDAPAPSATDVPGIAPQQEEMRPGSTENDQGLAWLEGLAEKHGAKPEELITPPDARTEKPPDWIENLRREDAPVPEGWAPVNQAQDEPRYADAASNDASSADAPLDWLSGLAAPDAFAEMEKPVENEPRPVSADETMPADVDANSDADLPAWLADKAPESTSAMPMAEPEAESNVQPGTDLPDWLADLDTSSKPSLAVPDAVPTPIPDWHPTASEKGQQPAEDVQWRPRDAEAPVEASQGAVPRPAAAREAVPGRARSAPSASAEEAPSLGVAKTEMGRGNIAAALDVYGKLIKKGRSLQEIIRELRDALYRYPVEVPIWQALGDAYMRANRLQEALDAYTKAEELLR